VSDSWLDWLPEYDMALGAPLGLAKKHTSHGSSPLWSRSFASGTSVVFDSNTNNGTIRWANGKVQSGAPRDHPSVGKGCVWESL
jgi:hypothetical protein